MIHDAYPSKLRAESSKIPTYVKPMLFWKSQAVVLSLDVIPGMPLVLLTAEWRLLRALHLSPEASSYSSLQPAMQAFRDVFPHNM